MCDCFKGKSYIHCPIAIESFLKNYYWYNTYMYINLDYHPEIKLNVLQYNLFGYIVIE